jgi:hypothetical protein
MEVVALIAVIATVFVALGDILKKGIKASSIAKLGAEIKKDTQNSRLGRWLVKVIGDFGTGFLTMLITVVLLSAVAIGIWYLLLR